MILAAEQIFFAEGFANAKMEDIARQANCSKTTIYTYFESKENLYMAITYRAFENLMEIYYLTLDKHFNKSGFERVAAIFKAYLEFSEKQYNYQQLLIEYLTFIRTVSSKGQENKMAEQLKQSYWFRKVRDIHNMPITVIVQQIKDGQKDGSIINKDQPLEIFLTIWALILGYTKLNIANPKTKGETLFQVNFRTWKQRIFELIESILLK